MPFAMQLHSYQTDESYDSSLSSADEEEDTTSAAMVSSPNHLMYGVNRFKASLFMFIPDYKTGDQWKNGLVSNTTPVSSGVVTTEGADEFPVGKPGTVRLGEQYVDVIPEVTFRRVTIRVPQIEVKNVSETVVVGLPLRGPETHVVSHLEFKGPRRYKNHVQIRPSMQPQKYSETHYVYINNTRKRYVSRTHLQPRHRIGGEGETLYLWPKTAMLQYETVLTHRLGSAEGRWFKTCLDIEPKPNTSTYVTIPPILCDTSLYNDNSKKKYYISSIRPS